MFDECAIELDFTGFETAKEVELDAINSHLKDENDWLRGQVEALQNELQENRWNDYRDPSARISYQDEVPIYCPKCDKPMRFIVDHHCRKNT
jgi:hypothetical protein